MKRILVVLLLLLLPLACKPSPQEGAKKCADECVAASAEGDALEGCRDTCAGKTTSVQEVCMALKRSDLGCVSHYVTMQKSEAKGYACAARCIARDKNEAACASACGVNAAPPLARDPMNIPP